MIPDFETYCLNEASLKTIKKELHGVLNSKNRNVMRKLLKKHVVYFKFKKKNGDLRRAVGTLISSYLPPLRGGSPKPEHQMVYYDLEKEHWRSFRSFSFIKILDIKSEDDYTGKKKHVSSSHEEKHDKHKEEISKHHEEEKEKKGMKHDDEEIKHEEDTKKKEYKVGDKIPEKELMRRSTDFRHHSKKNKFTKKSNDAHKKGDLDKDKNDEEKDKEDE